MKSLFLIIPIVLFFLANREENNIKPIVTQPMKNSKIINTYKHPYYSRYINYLDNLNSLYTNHQNMQNQEGC